MIDWHTLKANSANSTESDARPRPVTQEALGFEHSVWEDGPGTP